MPFLTQSVCIATGVLINEPTGLTDDEIYDLAWNTIRDHLQAFIDNDCQGSYVFDLLGYTGGFFLGEEESEQGEQVYELVFAMVNVPMSD